jgi:hypothetical protein
MTLEACEARDVIREADRVRKGLYDRMAHGDEAHREWLKNEIDKSFEDFDRMLKAFLDYYGEPRTI